MKRKAITFYGDKSSDKFIKNLVADKDMSTSEAYRLIIKLGIQKQEKNSIIRFTSLTSKQNKELHRIMYLLTNLTNNLNQLTHDFNLSVSAWGELSNPEVKEALKKIDKLELQNTKIMKGLSEYGNTN